MRSFAMAGRISVIVPYPVTLKPAPSVDFFGVIQSFHLPTTVLVTTITSNNTCSAVASLTRSNQYVRAIPHGVFITLAVMFADGQHQELMEPFHYINLVPGKDVRGKLIDAFQVRSLLRRA